MFPFFLLFFLLLIFVSFFISVLEMAGEVAVSFLFYNVVF